MQGNPFAEELKKWTFVDSVSVTGAGGSSNTKVITLPSSYTELLVTVEISNIVYGSCVIPSPRNNGIAIYTGSDTSGNHTYTISAELAGGNLRVAHTYNRYGSSHTVDAKVYYR